MSSGSSSKQPSNRDEEKNMPEWTEKLNRLSLREFPDLFASHAVDQLPSLVGVYRGTFVGPGWLRATAGPVLALGGLGGWWGKRFEADGTAVNLVQRGGKLEPRCPMRLLTVTSALDGKATLALHYEPENRFPWPHIVDELRPLDSETVLGMTYVNVAALRGVATPFLLEFQAEVDEL
jgi:hypothetical protein